MRLFFSGVVGDVCVLLVGFCVLFCFVFLVLFWFSNCVIPFSSHKSCGGFQALVEGHWTYALTYVLVRRVSLRLLNLDCRYPRDLLQPARKKKDSIFFTQDFWHVHLVHASDLASPQGLQTSAIDTLAGDQLCQERSRSQYPISSQRKSFDSFPPSSGRSLPASLHVATNH